MRHKAVIIILSLFIVILGIVFWQVQNPKVWQYVILKSLKNNKDIRISQLTINDVDVSWAGVKFKEINTRIKVQGEWYYVSLGLMDLHHLCLTINHAAIISDQVNISDISLMGVFLWEGFRVKQFNGDVKANALAFGEIELTHLNALFNVNHNGFNVTQYAALLAQGSLTGNIQGQFDNQNSYQANIVITDINTFDLSKINEAVFGQFKGVLRGKAFIKGEGNRLVEVKGFIDASSGGMMKSEVLGLIANYLPQQQMINDLIATKSDFFVNKGAFYFETVSGNQWATQLNIKSQQANLDLNLKIDVNLDNNVEYLFKAIKPLLEGKS